MMNKGVLITGTHRSGTTWLNSILMKSGTFANIFEYFPKQDVFDDDHHKLVWDDIYHLPKEEQEKLKKRLQEISNFTTKDFLKDLKSIAKFNKSFPKNLNRILQNYSAKLKNKPPLFKEPHGLFAVEWMEQNLGLETIILIRHPGAFAGSCKVKNWPVDFSKIYAKKYLLETHLKPFADQIEKFTEKEHDLIDQSILFWNISYYRVLQYMKQEQKRHYLKHEDLSSDPINQFKVLYDNLGLEFNTKVNQYVNLLCNSEHRIDIEKKGTSRNDLIRNSNAALKNWKNRLTEEEIQRIRKGTQEIAGHFYNENDW